MALRRRPVAIFHFFGAALGAAALPLAHAALLRWLVPRHWLAAVLALLVVLAAVGDAPHGYGNTALLSSWQGDAIALFVFLPLVYAFAIRFALVAERAPLATARGRAGRGARL